MRRLLLLAVLSPVVGCLAAPPDKLWVDQRTGVRAIPDPARRADQLAAVCESAAQAGDASAVKLILKDFADDPRHDDLAGRCAGHLASHSHRAGRAVADTINDDGKRKVARDKVEATEEIEKAKS